MPALTLMCTTNASNDYVVSPSSASHLVQDTNYVVSSPVDHNTESVHTPSIHTPSETSSRSRSSSYMPALETPAAMSPDAMLAVYAAKRKPSTKKPLGGAQTTTSANGGMRVLYAPQQQQLDAEDDEDAYGGMEPAGSRLTVIGDKNPFRTSIAHGGGKGVSAYSETSRYSGMDPTRRAE